MSSGWVLFSLYCLSAPAPGGPTALARLPSPRLNPRLTAPIQTWDEAIPLGNGLMGGLLWGEGSRLRVSLDRGDMWDARRHPATKEPGFTYANLQKLVKERNTAEIQRLTDDPYDYGAPPTKLPAGRLEIDLEPTATVQEFELKLASAEGVARLDDRREIKCFYSAADRVAVMWIPGAAPPGWRIQPPAVVQTLGYPTAETGSEHGLKWFLQDAAGEFRYGVVAGERRESGGTLLAWTVVHSKDGADPLKIGKGLVANALDKGYARMLKPHQAWWKRFWGESAVELPQRDILQQYCFVQYLYGSASRKGAPPIPLQGVWTADNGALPPWKGDYHNDLNTQMTYMGYQASGRFEAGQCFFDFNTCLLPAYRKFAREFFGTPGANVPGVMALDGAPLTGWAQYSLAPTMAAWIGELYWQHWRFTDDREFLRTQAYPWCTEVATSIEALLKPDGNGVLVLPLSSSPEIFDNSLRAWLKPNSNYDIMCLQALFHALVEMATELGHKEAAAHWQGLSTRLGDYHVAADGTLLIAKDDPLPASHRHFSNLMAIYPFNLLTIEGSDADRRVISSTLKQWASLGTREWCGYSFSWMAALQARVGNSEEAWRNLDIFTKAFVLRNGFHANGDQSGKGYSGFTYRPFTLEGNMLACAAVHEMLLQSWRPPGVGASILRIFPAVSKLWADVAFDDLRAEGNHRVSARRVSGATTWFRIVVGRSGEIRIRDNFGGRAVRWSRSGVRKVGDDYIVQGRKGETLTAEVGA